MVPRWPAVTVVAHGFADAEPLPVALPVLLVAAVGAVAAAALIPSRPSAVARPLAHEVGTATRLVLRVLTAVAAAGIAVTAALGPADMALNPAPRLLFTVAWAGVLLASVVVGPWWRHANPLGGLATGPRVDAPRMLWPAVAGLAVFGVFEQVLEPSPMTALAALVLYLTAAAALALREGHRGLAEADPLQAVSDVLGSLAPLARGRRWWRSPRQGAAGHPVVPGLAALLGVLGGMNFFDALEPSGGVTTRLAIYVVVVALTAVAFWAAARPAWLAPALIPAVAGHLGAHYLFPVLVDTQVAAVLASDPLRRGWDLLGLTGAEIVAEPIPSQVGLGLMLLLLVAGHALAMVVAGDLAAQRLAPRTAGAALFGLRAVIVLSLVAGIYLRFGIPG